MANITINDIKTSNTMSTSELEKTKGGNYFNYWNFMYRNVFNPYTQPFGYGIQQQTFSRARSWDQHNQNWMKSFSAGW